MIHRIYSSLESFKTLELRPGLNILLADKSPGATDRQTRNGAGKTSLIELLHFLNGATCEAESIFKATSLVGCNFGADLDLGDIRASIERSGDKPSKVKVEFDAMGASISTSNALQSYDWDGTWISNTNWKLALGSLIFGLSKSGPDEPRGSYGPTFRSLYAYFVRRQSSGGFSAPTKNSTKQVPYDSQVAISYLLGLDWSIPQKWQHVRERERALKILKSESAKGTLGALIGATAELRTRLTVAEDKTRRLKENLANFRVLPEYSNLEMEASTLARQLGLLADENTIDLRLIADLEESFSEEYAPETSDLERLYNEAGVVLPGAVARRYEDVLRFHRSVIQNRRSYLGGELDAARRRVEGREGVKQRIGGRYTEVMGILKSYGALEQYSALQSELSRQEAMTETIRQRFTAAQHLEGEKTELDIERDRLLLRLQQDYREQEDQLKHAILVFEDISSRLYEEAGSLNISENRNGPQFDVKIHGEKSKGIGNMQIFCFDMMIMRLCAERKIGPGYLVHDSHLFDGVDERQVAKALQLGAEASRELGFQYITTLNSDALPNDLPSGFDLREYILPVRLTDATEDGGLFGIRF